METITYTCISQLLMHCMINVIRVDKPTVRAASNISDGSVCFIGISCDFKVSHYRSGWQLTPTITRWVSECGLYFTKTFTEQLHILVWPVKGEGNWWWHVFGHYTEDDCRLDWVVDENDGLFTDYVIFSFRLVLFSHFNLVNAGSPDILLSNIPFQVKTTYWNLFNDFLTIA